MHSRVFSFLISLLILLALISPAMAVTVERDVQERAVIGETITVKIRVSNDLDRTLNVNIVEKTIPEFEYLDKELIKKVKLEGLEYLYLEWSLKVPPNSQKEVTYRIAPKRIGTYYLPKTEVIASNAIYYGELSRIVVECDGDGFCNTTIENALNCPQDCPTGMKDGVCDAAKDNRVDPDCKEGVDPDDTAIYEEKIAEKHNESNMLIYAGILAVAIILAGVSGILLKKLK